MSCLLNGPKVVWELLFSERFVSLAVYCSPSAAEENVCLAVLSDANREIISAVLHVAVKGGTWEQKRGNKPLLEL